MGNERIASRGFTADRYGDMLAYREQTGGIVVRHGADSPTFSGRVWYEVITVPTVTGPMLEGTIARDTMLRLFEAADRAHMLQMWPSFGIVRK